jgi:hypothetical protein
MISKEDLDNYRFYQCVTTSNGYTCEKVVSDDYDVKPNSRLVHINNLIPNINILERRILKCKLIPKNIDIVKGSNGSDGPTSATAAPPSYYLGSGAITLTR